MPRRKILIVDDDIDICRNLATCLESAGYVALQARNGKVALEQLSNSSELPSLILLDLVMPIMDGFQFRQRQVEDKRLASIPIVILTSGGSVEAKAVSLAARAFIRKPFDVDSILRTVAGQLESLDAVA